MNSEQDYFAGIMREMKAIFLSSSFAFLLLLAGCATSTANPTPIAGPSEVALTRYVMETLTPTVTASPANAPTATLAPTQTPTPRPYSVKDNDTMIGIAFRNGLTLDELKSANPGVDPYTLSVGMTLYIPAPANSSATSQAPTPTPAALVIGNVQCLATATGGSYCFAVVSNGHDFDLGNVSAEFRLTNPSDGEVLTRPATLPVSRLSTGSAIVVFAYFAPPVFANPGVVLQLLTASQSVADPAKHAAASITDPVTQIAADGASATINGEAAVAADSLDANTVWVTAAAFDTKGSVVGVRRVELTDGVKAGETGRFDLIVYSLGGKIEKVEVFIDTLP